MSRWESCLYRRAAAASFNLETATQIFHSFSHARDANAERIGSRRIVEHSVRYPPAVVADGYDHFLGILLHSQDGLGAFRMEVNVCETGLYDAENREFSFFGESAQLVSYLELYMRSRALVNSAHIPLDCQLQAAII